MRFKFLKQKPSFILPPGHIPPLKQWAQKWIFTWTEGKIKNTMWSLKTRLPCQYIIPLCFSQIFPSLSHLLFSFSFLLHSHFISPFSGHSSFPIWITIASLSLQFIQTSSFLSSTKIFIVALYNFLLSVTGNINSSANQKNVQVSYFNLTYCHLIPSPQSLFQDQSSCLPYSFLFLYLAHIVSLILNVFNHFLL